MPQVQVDYDLTIVGVIDLSKINGYQFTQQSHDLLNSIRVDTFTTAANANVYEDLTKVKEWIEKVKAVVNGGDKASEKIDFLKEHVKQIGN